MYRFISLVEFSKYDSNNNKRPPQSGVRFRSPTQIAILFHVVLLKSYTHYNTLYPSGKGEKPYVSYKEHKIGY